MPSPAVNVEAMRDLIEQMLGRVEGAVTAATAPTTPALSPEESAMRIETRDRLVAQLTEMRGGLDRAISTLTAATASRITPQVLEGAVDPIVANLDNAFLIAHPAMASVRAARGMGE